MSEKRKIQVHWWRQEVAENQMNFTVEYILVEVRMRQQRKSGKCGESKGGLEGESMDNKGYDQCREYQYTCTDAGESQVSR